MTTRRARTELPFLSYTDFDDKLRFISDTESRFVGQFIDQPIIVYDVENKTFTMKGRLHVKMVVRDYEFSNLIMHTFLLELHDRNYAAANVVRAAQEQGFSNIHEFVKLLSEFGPDIFETDEPQEHDFPEDDEDST